MKNKRGSAQATYITATCFPLLIPVSRIHTYCLIDGQILNLQHERRCKSHVCSPSVQGREGRQTMQDPRIGNEDN